jgi:hypothetical protein
LRQIKWPRRKLVYTHLLKTMRVSAAMCPRKLFEFVGDYFSIDEFSEPRSPSKQDPQHYPIQRYGETHRCPRVAM